MKKLKKILLINWLYFSKQLIDVDSINFLTGENGSGKSTFIDALQIVLLGELSPRIFNQAANEHSQRSLDGYLRADMDDSGNYSRKGKDFSSYIVCEFFDDIELKSFSCGVNFDCRSDGTRTEHFFIFDGTIPEHCFIKGKTAFDITELRAYLKESCGVRAKIYDTHKQYRRDLLAKWNVHSEEVCRMLKTSVSFHPIVDIREFITNNICDAPDRPDIVSMQQNIKDYKHQEKLCKLQEDKLEKLENISRVYREWRAAVERCTLYRFLVDWAGKESLREEIEKIGIECEQHSLTLAQLSERDKSLSYEIIKKTNLRDKLQLEYNQSDAVQEQKRLDVQKAGLEKELRDISELHRKLTLDIRREAERMVTTCQRIDNLSDFDGLDWLVCDASTVRQMYGRFLSASDEILALPTEAFDEVEKATSEYYVRIRELRFDLGKKISELTKELDEKRAVLDDLKRNIKDYPRGLLSLREKLEKKLSERCGISAKIDILADVLEIREDAEDWRGVIEGYMNTQKFYLLIPPEIYGRALGIYNEIKAEYSDRSYGIVDVGKLREHEKISPDKNSLASKIETKSELARSYIDYLLGRVICCDSTDDLRLHRTSVTAEGMLYQGYVARPIRRELMESAYIGQRAIKLRSQQLEAETVRLSREIDLMRPAADELRSFSDSQPLFTKHFVHSNIADGQKNLLRKREAESELDEVIKAYDRLDLLWLDNIKREIDGLDDEIKGLNAEIKDVSKKSGEFSAKLNILRTQTLPEKQAAFDEKSRSIAADFTDEYINGTGLKRYESELARLKHAATVANNFNNQIPQASSRERDTQKSLFDLRGQYIRTFQPCSFREDAADNDEFEDERIRLSESELPKFREKIKQAHDSALEQFQNDFLAKLKSSIDQVETQVNNLNGTLRQLRFGTEMYRFIVERNPDYGVYYDMIMAPELMEGEGGLFAIPFQQKYGKLVEELFDRIVASDDEQLNARKQSELSENIDKFTDFRTYLRFDLETTDRNGSKQLLSSTLNKKSGGETQTPFYIAVLASFAQLYHVNDPSTAVNNTVRIVIFDEAFNKMDSGRIIESIQLLRQFGLQAIICTPPDKAADIAPLADRTLVVIKENYRMTIIPYAKEVVSYGETSDT